MKSKILKLAYENLIDEVRFIDADDFTAAHVGDIEKFAGRQPRDILPSAKSIIIFSTYIGMFALDTSPAYGRTSRLVLSGYYANIVRPLLPIVNFLKAQGYEALVSDGESDEINIPLKGAAVKAGLGWIGKNSLLINKRYGSFQALGAIITDADIGEDNREAEKCCGKCTKCIDSCPTNAIKAPYMLDRPNCLSDFFEDDDLDRVIEIRDAGDAGDTGTHPKDGGMSPSLPSLPRLGGYFFECDICQNACPWNQKHIAKPLETPHGKLFDSNKLNPIFELKHLKEMNEDTYKKEIAPLIIGHKLPYETFKRNISTLATL